MGKLTEGRGRAKELQAKEARNETSGRGEDGNSRKESRKGMANEQNL